MIIFVITSSRPCIKPASNKDFGVPTKSDTNRPVQSQKRARFFKIWIYSYTSMYVPLFSTMHVV